MPKIVNHDQYRKELLTRCFDVFAQHGYAEVSMKQIAEAVGVTTGTLYHYFPDKESLFNSLFTALGQRDMQAITDAVAQGATPPDRLAIALATLDEQVDYFSKQLLLIIEYRQHHLDTPSEQLDALQASNALVRAAAAEFFGLTDPRGVTLLNAIMDGLLIERFLGQPHATFADQADHITRLLAALTESKEN